LTTLLLRAGYTYVPYSSLESVVERSKDTYYLALRRTQVTIRTPEPDWQPWLEFFLRALHHQKARLEKKIERERLVAVRDCLLIGAARGVAVGEAEVGLDAVGLRLCLDLLEVLLHLLVLFVRQRARLVQDAVRAADLAHVVEDPAGVDGLDLPLAQADVVRQQERSRDRFRQLLSPYERDVQEQLFEITRYPELIAQIVEGGPKSTYELQAIAPLYPEEARAAALAAGSSHWKVVARIDALLRDEATWLEARIAHLPEAKREAFRALVATPELLALLAENTTLAVLLGDAYEREPEAVVAWLAAEREHLVEKAQGASAASPSHDGTTGKKSRSARRRARRRRARKSANAVGSGEETG